MNELSIKYVFLNRILKHKDMNKVVNKFLLALWILTLVGGQLRAQFTTTFAKNASPGQQNGLYYSLPQTMLKLDFVVRETEYIEGPLADFADTYFGSEDAVSYSYTSYELLGLELSSEIVPDPNATFFVTFTPTRGNGNAQFEILPNGILRSVGIRGKDDALVETVEKQSNTTTKTESLASSNLGFMTLVTAGKSNAQLAREAADKIEEIRKARLFLISGDNGPAFVPETFNAMCTKLDEMEQQYLSLFLGNKTTREMVKTVYVIPNKEVLTQTVAKFSETGGFTEGTTGSGTPIMVQTLPLNTTASINAPSQSAIESMSYENKVFYRIPETANIKVTYNDKTLIEERQTVNQFGVILMAPLQNSRLVFDTNTGQIINMTM